MLFLVENDGVLILSGKEPAGEEIKTADKNSVTAGNNADILNVNGGLVKLSNLTLKDSKTAAIIANSAVFQAINASFANMNNGAVKNASNASLSGKNDFVNNSVAAGNGGALNLEKESRTKFSDSFLFENNTVATGNGGAIYGDGSLYFGDQNKLISAVFTNNTAIDGGAVLLMKMENLLVTANLYSDRIRSLTVIRRQTTAARFIIRGKCLLWVLTPKKLKALCLPQTKLQTVARFIIQVR